MNPIKIGLVGYGTVGKGVAKILETNRRLIESRVGAPVELAAVCDIRPVEPAALYVPRYQDLIARADIDIVVELIGGYEPARTVILTALAAGKNVVTANKAVLAKYWNEVFLKAHAAQKLVYFEASVGGAIPVIQGLSEGLAANRIEKITGILNGTTNYILTEMTKKGIDFAVALKQAQKAGFAESDPTFDVEGIDTANKLAILSSLAWGSWIKVPQVFTRGITQITKDDVYFAGKFGYVIKLIGQAQRWPRGLSLSVQPCLVPLSDAFATVEKEYNAVEIRGDAVGDIMFYGKGAGQLPAASAVVSDIIVLAREVANGTAGKNPLFTVEPSKKTPVIPQNKTEGAFYLRFIAVDKPGVLSRIAGVLGRYGVSIARVHQEEPQGSTKKGVPVIMLTHRATYGNLVRALAAIDRLPIVQSKSNHIKIEN